MRLRGLFVNSSFRNMGISKSLINQVITHARNEKCSEVWAMCRLSNNKLFEKHDFTIKLQTDRYEYGPHCIMVKKIMSV